MIPNEIFFSIKKKQQQQTSEISGTGHSQKHHLAHLQSTQADGHVQVSTSQLQVHVRRGWMEYVQISWSGKKIHLTEILKIYRTSRRSLRHPHLLTSDIPRELKEKQNNLLTLCPGTRLSKLDDVLDPR